MASLISRWRCDSASGDVLVDDAGTNNGTVYGATIVAGVIQNALSFDGNNDEVVIADSADFSFGNGSSDAPFSVSAWVNFGSLSGTHLILAKDGFGEANREWSFALFNGALRLFIKSQGGFNQQSVDADMVFETGRFYHLVATYDGRGGNNAADGMKIYVDGSPVALTNVIKNTYVAMANTDAPLLMGRYFSSYALLMLDHPGVHSGVLSQAEVTSLFEEPWPYEIKGVVTQDGLPVTTQVRLYDASSGELLDILNTDANGVYQQVLTSADPVYAMAVPNTGYRPLVHGPINPSLRNP